MLDAAVERPESIPENTQVETFSKRAAGARLRPIEPGDADAVFALCKQAHEKTPANVFKLSERRFAQHLDAYFNRKDRQACIVAETKGEIVGMVWVKCGPFMYSDDGLISTIMMLNVDSDKLSPFLRVRVFGKLLKAAKATSNHWGALQLVVHSTVGDQAGNTDRLLKLFGAHLIGGNYCV